MVTAGAGEARGEEGRGGEIRGVSRVLCPDRTGGLSASHFFLT